MNKYKNITEPLELYSSFKIEFYNYIVKNLPDHLELGGRVIEAFNDYSFNKVRILLDDAVNNYADIIMLDTENGVNDEVDNNAYRTLKKLDNMYLEFDKMYSELLENKML
jgi:hypothetical protein